MKNPKLILLATGLAPLGLLGAGLYFQHVHGYLPCPLCILQRYAFAAIAIISLFGLALPRAASRMIAALAALAALSGLGVAAYHLWVMAHPAVACGRDPLEAALNLLPSAETLPFLFKADGLCTTDYPPIFGISFPMWAFLWFLGFAVVLGVTAFRRAR